MSSIETPHFTVANGQIQPRFPCEISNELTDYIAAELVPLGLVPDNSAFERIFVDSVLVGQPDPMRAWAVFYGNTMRRLRRPGPAGTDSVATFARIYAHALALVRGAMVLDVGCCFGFLPLLAAEQDPRRRVVGTDLVPAAAALAGRVSWMHGSRARFAAADLLALPVADEAVDTVLAIHVLEHLPAEVCTLALAQLRRVARRRVVIAVPLEEVPDPTFGHVQAFDLLTLARIGLGAGTSDTQETPGTSGWSRAVHVADGGWLVLDRVPQPTGRRTARSGRPPLS
jgi:SAM-dependent methyltransferase